MPPSGEKEKAVISSSMEQEGLSRFWARAVGQKEELTQRTQRAQKARRREEKPPRLKPKGGAPGPTRSLLSVLEGEAPEPLQQPKAAQSSEQNLRSQRKRLREKEQVMVSRAPSTEAADQDADR